jgi:hypothetical protein
MPVEEKGIGSHRGLDTLLHFRIHRSLTRHYDRVERSPTLRMYLRANEEGEAGYSGEQNYQRPWPIGDSTHHGLCESSREFPSGAKTRAVRRRFAPAPLLEVSVRNREPCPAKGSR